jgi:hypothetical protein
MDGGISVNPPSSQSEGANTNSGYTSVIAVGDMTLAITSCITLNFVPFTASNGVNWTPNLNGDRIWTWGEGYGSNVKTLLQYNIDRINLETKNDWCYVWAGGQAEQGGIGTQNLVFFAKDINGTIFTWGTNSYGQLGVGQNPICPVCDNDYVNPIGLCFNSIDSECPCPDCECVTYTLSNYSTLEVPFTYIDCNNTLINSILGRGGLGPSTTTVTICACLNTIVIDENINPNFVNITTDQNPCES